MRTVAQCRIKIPADIEITEADISRAGAVAARAISRQLRNMRCERQGHEPFGAIDGAPELAGVCCRCQQRIGAVLA